MEFDFPSNKMIDLTQAFDEVLSTALVDSIYRFKIYRTTPSNVQQFDKVEYFSVFDSETQDMATIGVLFILHEKTLQVQTKVCISQGDVEVFQFVFEELIERMSQKKMVELKKNKSTNKSVPKEKRNVK